MNTNKLTSRRTWMAGCAAAAALTFSTVAMAHGDAEHVKGSVTKVADGSFDVKTTDGKSMTIEISAKTKISRGGKTAAKTDIHVGDRVVVHAEKEGKKLVAETIELGAAGATN